MFDRAGNGGSARAARSSGRAGVIVHGERTMFARSLREQDIETLRLAALTRLHSLSFDELGQLAPAAGELWVPAGRRLLLGGPLHHELALIAEGLGLLRCAGETLAELGPGDVFGELSSRRPGYATATVYAATALHLVVFGTRALRIVRERDPDAVDALIAACSLDAAERAAALAGPRPVPQLTLISTAAAA
jgi:CRP-like cAMP-binding protein